MRQIFTLMLIFISSTVFSQTPFYDAIKLKKYVNANGRIGGIPGDRDGHIRILRNYLPNEAGLTDRQVLDSLDKRQNPFLDTLIVSGGGAGLANKSAKLLSRISSSVSGIDVTTIANGVSMLMIDRAKQELTVTFFNRFKKFAEENPEFNVLFPKTTDNLDRLLAYKYPEMLPALRTGFFEDLNKLTYNLDDVLELPRYKALLINFPEVRVAIRSIRLVHEIESGESNAAEVLNKFAAYQEWNEPGASGEFSNFGNSVKLAAIFSQSLRSDTIIAKNNKAWVSIKYAKQNLLNDPVTLQIYLGLLYQQVKNQSIHWKVNGVDTYFTSIMRENKDNIFLFENKITEFIELAEHAEELTKDLKTKKESKIAFTNDDYYNYIDASMDIIEYGLSIAHLFDRQINVKAYTVVARKSNDLYRHIYKKEYTQAFSNGMDILTSINTMLNTEQVALWNTVYTRFSSRFTPSKKIPSFSKLKDNDLATIKAILSEYEAKPVPDRVLINQLKKLIALYSTQANVEKFGGVISELTKYGFFMANITSAETSEEVKDILDNAILPVGSSSIKKNSTVNVAVQSYLGAYARMGELNYQTNSAWSDRLGVIAPVGISLSTSLKKGGSLSLFGSLFDIGAIVDYQLKKDSVITTNGSTEEVLVKDYKIELGQILSPGGYLVYGFHGNIPLSIGWGGQYGPGLSKINEDNTTIFNNPQWRWNVFLSVDIPFFNLANKTKSYKSKK